MLSLDKRIELLDRLKNYMQSDDENWTAIKYAAENANTWFTQDSINTAVNNICNYYLDKDALKEWVAQYAINENDKLVGIVMAGNIPLVGFHDFLCGFISGKRLLIKPSSKDDVLIRHVITKLLEWEPQLAEQIKISDLLKGCGAYIATGSNNSARYFEQYFAKYPHIIRKNRTSVAVLEGNESEEELNALGEDIFTYYGLGCRNVTQLYVPEDYDIHKILDKFSSYEPLMDHHRYKNNYDYHLAIYLLNKVEVLTNGSLMLLENEVPFSPVSVLHYQKYKNKEDIIALLSKNDDIQCIVNRDILPYGNAQVPRLSEYMDGVDTMTFLNSL